MQLFSFHVITGKNQEFLTSMQGRRFPAILFPEGRDESHVETMTICTCTDETVDWLVQLAMGDSFGANQLLKFHYIYPLVPRVAHRRLIAAWQRQYPELRGYAVLDAHGLVQGGEWLYNRSEVPAKPAFHPVQEWVDEYDGKALVLLIFACNPENNGIVAKKSVVVHFNGDVKTGDDGRDCEETGVVVLCSLNYGGLRFYVPGHGYLEDKPNEMKRLIRQLPA